MERQKVTAYCFTKNLKLMTDEDLRNLDMVHVAFALIDNGEVVWKGKAASKSFRHMKEVNPMLKIILSVGGWGADGFSQAAMTEEGRKRLAASAIELVKQYGFDGIDIDWEYPGIGVGGIASDPADKENYTLLLCELRSQLDSLEEYKTLSIAAGGDAYFLEHTDMAKAGTYLDYVQLMTYDLRGGFQIVTGHHANLYGPKGDLFAASTDNTVNLFIKAGVPVEKLVIGVAFYGRKWRGVQAEKGGNGLHRMAKTTGGTSLRYDEIEALIADKKSGYRRYWDEHAQAAWAFNGKDFISYEDELAVVKKAEYAKARGMYGVMYWEYALDSRHELTALLRKHL